MGTWQVPGAHMPAEGGRQHSASLRMLGCEVFCTFAYLPLWELVFMFFLVEKVQVLYTIKCSPAVWNDPVMEADSHRATWEKSKKEEFAHMSPAVCSKAATCTLLLVVSQLFMSELSNIHSLLVDFDSFPTAAELQWHHSSRRARASHTGK